MWRHGVPRSYVSFCEKTHTLFCWITGCLFFPYPLALICFLKNNTTQPAAPAEKPKRREKLSIEPKVTIFFEGRWWNIAPIFITKYHVQSCGSSTLLLFFLTSCTTFFLLFYSSPTSHAIPLLVNFYMLFLFIFIFIYASLILERQEISCEHVCLYTCKSTFSCILYLCVREGNNKVNKCPRK